MNYSNETKKNILILEYCFDIIKKKQTDSDLKEFLKHVDSQKELNISEHRQRLFDDTYQFFNEQFHSLVEKTEKDNIIWDFSTFKIFQENLPQQFIVFKKFITDSTELDFYEYLIDYYNNLFDSRNLKFFFHPISLSDSIKYIYKMDRFNYYKHPPIQPIEIYELLTTRNKLYIEANIKKKLKLLEELTKGDESKFQNKKIETETPLDLSQTKATEKIIYLDQLGILDFLKKQSPFNTSTNKLATVLSAITGENASTLQSYLNPIYSNKVDEKNNPLIKKTKVSKVKSQLTEQGFTPKKT